MQSHVGGWCVDKDDSECARGEAGGEGLMPVAAGVWVCGGRCVGVSGLYGGIRGHTRAPWSGDIT